MKQLVVIEQGCYLNHPITKMKHEQLKKNNIDVIRLNWKHNHDPMASYTLRDFNGKIPRWSEGKEFLISKSIDKYRFIMYTDEDTYIQHFDPKIDPWQELLQFLSDWNPIAANINTRGVWSYDQRVVDKVSKGENCIIMHHDACNFIIRNDMCKLLHPIKFHGSDRVMWYQQFMCHIMRESYYLSPANLIAKNEIHQPHHYNDSRAKSYTNSVLQSFAKTLIDEEKFLNYYCQHNAATSNELLSKKPLKNAPEVTIEEFRKFFK